MSDVGYGTLQIIPSAKGFKAALGKEVSQPLKAAGDKGGKDSGSGFKTGFLGSLKGIAGPIAAAFAGVQVFSFLKDSVGEAREAQKVGAITAQTIKATGGAAKITADQVGTLAGAISGKTGIDDEAIQSGANLLLTFKNVRNEVGKGSNIFDRATQAATDLSAAGFGDLNGASKQLGKALNDPIKGITALSRSGVTFTAQQEAQIKTMVKSGDILGAQKIILGEVEHQVGGVAAASATMGEKSAVAFGNLKEQIGTAMLPALDAVQGAFVNKIAPAISGFISGMQDGTGAGGQFASIIKDVASRVVSAFGAFRTNVLPVLVSIGSTIAANVVPAVRSMVTAFAPLVASVVKFAVSIGANVLPVLLTIGKTILSTVVPGIASLVRAVAPLIAVAIQIGSTIAAAVMPAFRSIATYIMGNLAPIFTAVVGIITQYVVPAMVSMGHFIADTLVPAVISIYSKVAEKLKPILDALFQVIQTRVIPAVQLIAQKFQEWQPTIQKVISVVVTIVGKVLEFAAAILGKVLPVAIKFAGWLITVLVKAIIGTIETIAKIIGKLIDFGKAIYNAGATVVKFVKDVVKFFTDLPGKISAALGNAVTWLVQKGKDFIQGLRKGVINAAVALWTWWQNLTATIHDKIGNVASSLAQKGKDFLNGLKNGVVSGATAVYNFFKDLPGAIVRKIGNLASTLSSAGKDMARGFINGIGDMVGKAADKAKELANAAKNAVKNVLGINSPSKVLTEIGVFTGQGFANGMKKSTSLVTAASQGMASAAVRGASLPIRSASASGIASSHRTQIESARQVLINVNGANDPEATARIVGRKLADQGV